MKPNLIPENSQFMGTIEKRLTVNEQRKIIEEKFQKLKAEFLTKEQSKKVHLRNLSEDY